MRKPKRFQAQKYWNRPVPSFGDVKARLLIIGLAPALNGGNRTGRMFTGDSTGDWLIKALYETGFANSPYSYSVDDGLLLKDTYVTSAVKCAPPDNKPSISEIDQCSKHLKNEIKLLNPNLKVIITLGNIALNAFSRITNNKRLKFKHGATYNIGDDTYLIVSYHPSRRNTNTKVLTWSSWIEIFKTARRLIDDY
jgi:uracil-DNA glycosylase family 4